MLNLPSQASDAALKRSTQGLAHVSGAVGPKETGEMEVQTDTMRLRAMSGSEGGRRCRFRAGRELEQ